MKVAIWGAGKMGQIHGEAYRKMGKSIEIAYIIERDSQKATEFSKKFKCMSIDDLRGIARDSIDIIDICLPTYLHMNAVRQAADVCHFIFCEKPICLTSPEYDELHHIVKDSGCHLMIGQVLRFWNGYVKARNMVLQGEIGTPRLITCLRRQKMPAWSKGNWLMDNHQSGGLLMDLCIHDIDYLYWMMGLPGFVSCEIVERDETSLHAILNVTYQGCCANIIGSWGMPEKFHGGELESLLEIVGDTGMITYTGGGSLEVIRGSEKECISLVHEDGYENELLYFVDCASKHMEPERSNLSSVEGTMKILWAAKEAAKQKQIVQIGNISLCD